MNAPAENDETRLFAMTANEADLLMRGGTRVDLHERLRAFRDTRVAVVRPTRDALTQCIDHAINGPDLDGDPSGGWMASHIAESLIRAGFVAVSDSQETPQ